MAAVTYDGVPSAEGGNIFKDMSFWVALRIPSRKHYVEQIESNGGKVVPLERQADMLIADHARPKFAPQGSYSWKYIDDSVKNGIAQLKERYLIGLDPSLPRPAGGGAGAKSKRTPFSQADDLALVKWVLTHNSDRGGNKIYQELAAKNPRHTWQSWRDRFVKKLQILPVEKLQKMAESAPEEPPTTEHDEVEEEAEEEEPPIEKPQEPAKQRPSQSRKKAPPPQTKRAELPESSPGPTPDHAPEPNPQVAQETQDNDRQPTEENDEAESDSSSMKNRFYQDLNEYILVTEADIKLQPKISGRIIELYDLSMAVEEKQQERGSEALTRNDWAQIAQSLGFLRQDDATLSQLQECFDENLAEFLSAIRDYSPDGGIDETEADADLDSHGHSSPRQHGGSSENRELTQPQESDWVEESPSQQAQLRHQQSYIRSSPPIRTKRPFDQLPLTSSGPLTKRTRFDKKVVIPSTPDMVVGEGRRVPSTQYLSPSIRKSLMRQDYVDASEASQQLPPLPPADEDELEEDDGEEEDPEPEVQELTPKPIRQKSPLLDTEDIVADHAPSQQLQFEALNPSPIPFSLSKSSQAKKGAFARSASNPVQRPKAGLSNQRQELDSRQPIVSPTQRSPIVVQITRASRRSLPSSFRSKPAASESAFNQKQPAKKSTPPKRQPSKAHSAPQPAPSPSNRRDIDQWIQYYEALGFPRSIVIEGLKRTTLTPGTLASVVMQKLHEGQGVPSNYEGIWTDRDDADLQFIGTIDFSREPVGPIEERQYRRAQRAIKRLDAKHHEERVKLRSAFLEAQGMGERSGELGE